jgi:hypothetical protein
MDNLYEEIDLVLAESLLKEELMLLLEGFEDGPGRQAIEAMVNNIFDSDKISDDEKGEIFASMKEDLEEILEYFLNTWDKLEPDEKIVSKAGTEAGEAQEDITDAMLDFIAKYTAKMNPPGDEERFMQMIIGEPKEGTPSVLYQKKHMQAALWALRFVRDAADATEPEDEPEETEPEETPTPEPEAITTAEKEEVADYLDEAAELLAVQALNSGRPSQLIPKFGRILKNFFITKRVLRKGALTEELRSLDEEEASPGPSKAAKIDPSGTKDDELIKVLTKEIEVTPEQARKAFEELQGELKVKKIDDAFEEEIKKREAKGIKYLILRAAGVGIVGAVGALKEGKLAPMVLDLDALKRGSLDEGLLGMFGAWIEYYMRGIFGGWAPNIQVKGSKSDVEAFARTINGEAKYMDAVRRYGLDHPTTYKNKAKLDNSVKNFERDTGIKWPFK